MSVSAVITAPGVSGYLASGIEKLKSLAAKVGEAAINVIVSMIDFVVNHPFMSVGLSAVVLAAFYPNVFNAIVSGIATGVMDADRRVMYVIPLR